MPDLPTLLALGRADFVTVLATLDAAHIEREPVTGYQNLTDVEVIDAPGGERVFVRGDAVKLVYVDGEHLPDDLTSEAVATAVGSDGETLTSRQGRHGKLHVVAGEGVAWSEAAGDVGFLELFPPMTFEEYRAEVYRTPRKVIR